MKKFLALALSFALTLPLAACGGNPGNASAPPSALWRIARLLPVCSMEFLPCWPLCMALWFLL